MFPTMKMHKMNIAAEARYEDVSAFACAFYAECEHNDDAKCLARSGISGGPSNTL